MNDPEQDAFERQLRQIQPASLPDEMLARLEHPPTIVPPAQRHPAPAGIDLRALIRFLLPALGAATAFLLLLAAWHGTRHRPVPIAVSVRAPQPPPLVCQSSAEAVVAARDEGIYAGADGRTVQVVRLLDLNQSVWTDPRSGTRLVVVVPHQHILVKDIETD